MEGCFVEIELLFELVVDHPLCPDLPKRCAPVLADFAGGDGGLVKLAIAPVDAVDLLGRQLQLLVQDQPGTPQQAVLQIRVQFRRIRQDQRVLAFGDDDGPLDGERAGGLVVADRAGAQAGFALKGLHVALGHQRPVTGQEDLVGHQHRRGWRALLCPGGQWHHGEGQYEQPAAHAFIHPLHVKAGQVPAGSQPQAAPRRRAERESARSRQGFVRSCE